LVDVKLGAVTIEMARRPRPCHFSRLLAVFWRCRNVTEAKRLFCPRRLCTTASPCHALTSPAPPLLWHQGCQDGRCHEPHLKGKPTMGGFREFGESHADRARSGEDCFSGSRASARKARSSSLASFGAGRCWSFSAGSRP
jgi:hypothetical protein